MKTILSFPLILLLLVGCATKLDPAGPYKGDKLLFEVDQTLTTGFTILDTYVKWEKDYRPQLHFYTQIKMSADRIRKDAKAWFKTAYALRDAYVANPSETNRDALLKSIRIIRVALAETASYMAQYGPTATLK